MRLKLLVEFFLTLLGLGVGSMGLLVMWLHPDIHGVLTRPGLWILFYCLWFGGVHSMATILRLKESA